MKICIISSYPPEKEGVGRFTKRLVDNFDPYELEISVLTFNYKTEYKEKNIYQTLGASPKNIINTYKLLTTIKPDIIHVQYATPVYRIYSPLLWAVLWGYRTTHRVKIIITFHEVSREIELLKTLGIKYYSLMSKVADQIIVHTNEAKKILIKKCNVNVSKIAVIPLGLFISNASLQAEGKASKIINKVNISSKNNILFFGYIHLDKGIEYLIKALDLLYKEYPIEKSKTLLLIAGEVRPRKGVFRLFEIADHFYKKRLIKLTNELSLEKNVKFLSYIKDKDVIPLMRASRVIVMPYKKVEQSGVLNLALNFNIPVIASNIGGLKELLEDTGLTVKSESPQLLAEKLYFVLKNKRISNLGRIYTRIRAINSLEGVIDKHRAIYKKMYG